MAALGWAGLGLTLQALFTLRYMRLIGKGRILSRPLWRFRFFAPLVGYTMLLTTKTRYAQIAVLSLIYVPTTVFVAPALWPTACFWIVIIACYADDYYTGDDERWQKMLGWWKRWRAKRRALRKLAEAK